jgi:carboxymethylenebutenolidase
MAEQAAARSGADVTLGSEGGPASGYLALPASRCGPGVVVIHEWWGVVDHVRDVCDRLAREGFVALAPDLYRGRSTQDPGEAERLMMGLDLPRAAADLDAALATLLGHDAVIGPRLGVVGFCMGGQLALFAATQSRRIGAVVDFYGIHPKVALDLSALEAPVLGIFAERDAFVPPEAARELEARLRAAGKRVTLRILPGVEHAFFNDTRPDVFNALAAAQAFAETLAFLRAELA